MLLLGTQLTLVYHPKRKRTITFLYQAWSCCEGEVSHKAYLLPGWNFICWCCSSPVSGGDECPQGMQSSGKAENGNCVSPCKVAERVRWHKPAGNAFVPCTASCSKVEHVGDAHALPCRQSPNLKSQTTFSFFHGHFHFRNCWKCAVVFLPAAPRHMGTHIKSRTFHYSRSSLHCQESDWLQLLKVKLS